ncbi:hypothetical protein EON65_46600 [archaeon]|nr:MAG: hypothetical protein EON65_46600 [archaeon]
MYANSNCNPDGFQQTNLINVTAPGVCGPYPPSTPVDDVENIYNGIYTCTTSQSLDLGSNYVMTK